MDKQNLFPAEEVGTRRKKPNIVLLILLILAIALVMTVVVNVFINRNFTVSFYQIRSEKVSDNIRIIELSDLHNKQYGKNNSKLVGKIKALNPDLIVYAGDMMNYKNDDYSVLWNLTEQLSEIAPIYACHGNNELDQYLFRDKQFVKELEARGVNYLSNEAVDVKVKNTVLQLIAVSDNLKQYDIETNNSKKFVESLKPTDNCRICLTHYPELFKEKLLDKGIDVALTGHAHGGLVRIPFVGGLYSTGEGFLPTFTSGVYEMEDGALVVVSRGLGSSSFFPRINNQPELVVADICWY